MAERMPSDPNIMPKIAICGCFEAIGASVRRVIELGRVTEPLSNHANRGASVMLDEQLDNQGELEFPEDFGF